jgi:hypothetical protein
VVHANQCVSREVEKAAPLTGRQSDKRSDETLQWMDIRCMLNSIGLPLYKTGIRGAHQERDRVHALRLRAQKPPQESASTTSRGRYG